MAKPRTSTRTPTSAKVVDLSGADTLDAVVALLGPSSEAEVDALLGPTDPAALIADGVQHATHRIASDTFRVVTFAHAWLNDPKVPAGTRADLRLGADVLRVLAWSAARGAEMERALPQRSGSARRVVRDAAARELTAARARREQLADTLLKVAGPGSAHASRITAARRPDDALEIDASLKALVSVGRELLAAKDPAVQTRRAHWKLDGAWLDACESLATRARGHREVVQKPGALAPTQKQLDAWDGVVLRLLGDVVGAFNRANAVNPEVPRVAYVSLRARTTPRRRTDDSPSKPVDP